MIKLVALVTRKTGMTQEAFRDYWTGVHAPLAAQIPGMRGYRINVADDPGDMPAAPYHGSAEIWFDSRAAMEAGLGSEEGFVAGEDTAHFTDGIVFLVTEETVVIGRAAP